tara:strand:+ start:574 stop:939 length:366 start_codon:yes stop_codon:yes gene_type:complete
MNFAKFNTIDVEVKKHHNNGNTYFAGTITLDFNTDKERTYLMPFQYGYGYQWEHEMKATLSYFNEMSIPKFTFWSQFLKENNIDYRTNIIDDCRQKELKELVNNYDSLVEYIRDKKATLKA